MSYVPVPDWDDIVPKKDTEAVFKRLKSNRANRECIDCPQQSQWATIPHGSFLCISCSGVHRSIGVHITFVRSTSMDEWTWGQLRLMQVGGNAKAKAYYTKNGLTTADLSEKYQSQVARTYRTKLEQEARKLHKKLGGALFESEGAGSTAETDASDFFSSAAEEAKTVTVSAMKLAPVAAASTGELSSSLSGAAGDGAPKKKLLLKKKAGKKPKKGGLGAVKKVGKQNFDEIESRLGKEDDERAEVAASDAASAAATTEAITKRLEKFAVKTTSRDMTKMDEQKLAQAERLGMGISRQTTNASVFSHSTSSAMQEVEQESEDAKGSSVFDREARSGYLDREPSRDSDGYGGRGDDDFFKSYGN